MMKCRRCGGYFSPEDKLAMQIGPQDTAAVLDGYAIIPSVNGDAYNMLFLVHAKCADEGD